MARSVGISGWFGRAASAALFSAAACAPFAAPGCKSAADDGEAAPLGEAEFRQRYATAYCNRVALCCQAANTPFDGATCATQFLARQYGGAQPAGGAGGAGAGAGGGGGSATALAVSFDAAAAKKCLEKVEAEPSTCASLFPEGAELSSAGSGQPAGGPVKVAREDCLDAYKASKKVGDACSDSRECPAGDNGYAYCNPQLAAKLDGRAGIGLCQQIDFGIGRCDSGPTSSSESRYFMCDGSPCVDNYCPTIRALGEPCVDHVTRCEDGSYCEGMTCKALPKAGEACLSGVCGPSAYCESSGQTCAPRKAEGEACEAAGECGPNHDCTSGKCTLRADAMCALGR